MRFGGVVLKLHHRSVTFKGKLQSKGDNEGLKRAMVWQVCCVQLGSSMWGAYFWDIFCSTHHCPPMNFYELECLNWPLKSAPNSFIHSVKVLSEGAMVEMGSPDEFEKSKVGVKGLVDSGMTKLPEFLVLPPDQRVRKADQGNAAAALVQVPIIDLQGLEGERRVQIISEIRGASESWGMFYMVNHGVPLGVMNKMLEDIRLFHEQPKEAKLEFYTRDPARKVQYSSSFHRSIGSFLWKDSLSCVLEGISSADLPLVCREALRDYVSHMIKLKQTLSALLSESLGLDSDHLERIGCMEASRVAGHYYPACPEPELTIGTTHHSDPFFLTILLTNNVDGLQVLHQDQWIDVLHMEGALIGTIGDMLQLVSNDAFKSAEHRVLARRIGPRLSVACFFYPSNRNEGRKYGAIEELVSENSPPMYKEISFSDYYMSFQPEGIAYTKSLANLR